MQNQEQQNNQNQSKIGAIKGLMSLLPDIHERIIGIRELRARLNQQYREISQKVASSPPPTPQKPAITDERRKELEELAKKRQAERDEAERKVDERTQIKLATVKAERQAEKQKAPEQKPAPQPHAVHQPTPASQRQPSQHAQHPHHQPEKPVYNPSYLQPRPQIQSRTFSPTQTRAGFTPRPDRAPYPPRDGSRPPFPPRDPNRPFVPRDPNRPFVPRDPNRPYTPRPTGTGSNTPRPATAIKPTERFVPKVDTFNPKRKAKNFETTEKSAMDKRALMRRGLIEEHDIEERMLTRVFRPKKQKDTTAPKKEISNVVVINTTDVSIKTLSEKIGKPATEIIKQLMVLGNMCTINSLIDFDTASLVAGEFGIELQLHADKTFEEKLGLVHMSGENLENKLESRPPVVTIMGHVDHGKTSLLDKIRQSNVTKSEFGGITQHIGAYMVKCGDKKITFIDTPGHAAFEKMRARGAKITDIAILLVAADDGVMEQTVEAIKHIQKNKLQMIVACNKMDKPTANIERVREQLATHNVLTEEWGGDAILVPISAHTGAGIDKLLEMILLVAEMKGYRANAHKEAQGAIIDAHSDAQKGAMVTVLVQSGTLHVGDTILAGTTYGKVKRMTDENGRAVKAATPSMPVQVLGFTDVPKAGDICHVVDEKLTKQVANERLVKEKITKTRAGAKTPSEIDAITQLDNAAKKQLNVIIKGDVSGSVEAIIQGINNITSDEVRINVISHGVGVVNDNDVTLAHVASARLIAFNVKTSPTAVLLAKKEKTQIHSFNVIYRIFDFVTEEMVKLFTPKFNEIYYGKAEVLALFKSSAVGSIAGSMVRDGKIIRGAKVRLQRGGKQVGEYKVESLKIKKDDVKEVANGFECGIILDGNAEVAVGDIIECIGAEQQPIVYNGRVYG